MNGIHKLYQNNPQFRSLSSDDRSMLAQTTMIYTSALSASFIIHKLGLMDSVVYFDAVGMISHPSVIPTVQRMACRLDFDMTVMKLFLAVLSFSTTSCTVYSNTPARSFSNSKQILDIQNSYVDLLWRYLVYQHNHEHAVRCFSDLNRCIFAVNECVVWSILDVQWFTDTVDSIIEETEQSLNLTD